MAEERYTTQELHRLLFADRDGEVKSYTVEQFAKVYAMESLLTWDDLLPLIRRRTNLVVLGVKDGVATIMIPKL